MKKVLLIHGFTGTSAGLWFPWMKKELELRGYWVFAPQMPDTNCPVLSKWLTALEPVIRPFDAGDIIIAHSLGGKAALHAVLKNKKKIGRLILVAPAIGKRTESEWQKRMREWPGKEIPALRKFWEEKIDFDAVSQFADVTVIFSDNDPYIPACPRRSLPKEWNMKVWHGFGHFLSLSQPRLLEEVLKK